MDSQTYAGLSALEMGAMVRRGDVTGAELLACARERVAQVAALNPIAHLFDDALVPDEAAEDAPFAGVPYLVKDIAIQLRGTPMTMGSRLQSDLVCASDDTLAQRLRKSGLLIFGRTTMAEMGLGGTTNTTAFGPTRNPWNPPLNAGGSSGGSAVAVATGIVPFAHATDGFGSIRIPAAHCGLFGLKPSRMRVPVGPGVAEALAGMSGVHCIAFSVRDSAALLDAVHGPATGDPFAAPPMASCLAAIEAGPGRLRIAFSAEMPGGGAVAPDIRATVETMAKRLEDLGHHVFERPMAYDATSLRQSLDRISALTASVGIGRALARRGLTSAEGWVEPIALALAEAGGRLSAADYWEAVQNLHAVSRQLGAFFEDVDVFLSPTTAETALPALHPTPTTIEAAHDETFRHAPFPGVCNAAGVPGMTVPAGLANGVPVGVHFTGAYGSEPMLYALAAQIEAAHPWHRPPTELYMTALEAPADET